MSVLDPNAEYLKGTMKPFIAEVYGKATKITRSAGSETFANQAMMDSIICKLSEEVANLLHGMNDNHQTEIKTLVDQHNADKDEWIKREEDLLNQIDNIGQYSRRDNLKIIGVPALPDEDISQIVVDIVKHTGVQLEKDDISIAHHINTYHDTVDSNTNKKAPSIICKLKSGNKRSKIFDAKRQIRVKPSPPHPTAGIYDDVTPLRSRILYALRNKKVEGSDKKKCEFVWSREGRIYCRTEDESKQKVMNHTTGREAMPKPHIVNKPQDLEKLGWSRQEILDIIHNKKQ